MKNVEIRTSIFIASLWRSFTRKIFLHSVMLCVFCFFMLSPSHVLLAQIAAEEESSIVEESKSEFPGTYIFEWPDGKSVAEIYVDGIVMTGTLKISGGYTIQLVGTAQGKTAHGIIVGQSGTGDYGDFDATIDGDELELKLTPLAENGEVSQPLHIVFSRAAANVEPMETEDATDPDELPSQIPEGAGGDDRLIGSWVYQSLITSGSDSFASEQFLIFRADGSYSYGNGSAVAGGTGWSYNGGSDEGETERGYWRAEDGILYMLDSSGQWNRIGKFGMTEDGSTMRITYDSGGKKLWNRR